MSLTPLLIAPFKTGLDTDLEPWLAPTDSFSTAINVNIHHGYLEKRSGYEVFGQLIPNATPINISTISQANPGEVTTTVPHGYSTGDFVFITSVTGMTEVNNKGYTITVTGASTFTIGIDTSSFTAYAGGGTVALVDSDVDRVMGIFRFIEANGSKELLAFTTQRASVYNGVTNTFDQLDAANIMSGSEYDYIWAVNWQSTAVVNRLYFTNGKAYDGASLDGIRYYDGTGGVTNSFNPSLGGGNTLYGGKLLFVIKERLVVLNTYENDGVSTTNYPQRARWCQAQGPSNWNDLIPGGGGFVDCPTGEQIISARALQDIIIVNFTNSVWTIRPVPNPALPFRWDKINDFRACDGKMATVDYDRDVKALGVRGITATDGVETRRIDNRIEDFTIDEINVDEFQKVYCSRSYANRRWWTLFSQQSEENPDNTENNRALILDDESGAFTIYHINMNCLGYGNFGFDYGLNDFTAANNLDFSLNDMSEETLLSYYWQDNQEAFLGGNIFGTIFVLETQNDDDGEEVVTEFTTASWNPFKQQGAEALLSYLDFYIDTDQVTNATVEFYKDDDQSPYQSQRIDFLPNLDYVASIGNILQSNPLNVNAPSHGLNNGDVIYIYGVKGMVSANGGPYTITLGNENNFFLDNIDGTGFNAYTTGGTVVRRRFYKTKTWKRAYAGGTGYQHRIKFISSGTDKPWRIHALKPYFKSRGRRSIN